jgi:hypothetical protein
LNIILIEGGLGAVETSEKIETVRKWFSPLPHFHEYKEKGT